MDEWIDRLLDGYMIDCSDSDCSVVYHADNDDEQLTFRSVMSMHRYIYLFIYLYRYIVQILNQLFQRVFYVGRVSVTRHIILCVHLEGMKHIKPIYIIHLYQFFVT